MSALAAPSRRALALFTAFLVTLLGLVTANAVNAGTASAATGPITQMPAAGGGVTADGLPTVQQDGVAWSMATVGNTVWVAGSFTNARPAGAAAGTQLIPRNGLLAFDITTGVLRSDINQQLNTGAQAKVVTASPDGKRVYVGGNFTSISGVTRYRIAAFDAQTGALITTFAPSVGGTVVAIAATNDTVYVGGWFNNAGGQPRNRLAAFSAATGALLTWAPGLDNDPTSMVIAPDNSRLVIGGKFTTITTNGVATPAYGMGAVDLNTGAPVSWPLNTLIRNAGAQAGIYSLSTDADTVYGTNFNFGTGNYEGLFAANSDGTVKWLDDCHGDSYAGFSMGNVVYKVGHSHYCANIGGYPDTNPRVHHNGMAYTKAATGTVNPNGQGGSGYGNFAGQPAPSIINWFPLIEAGTYTGKSQAAWSLTGNGTYLVAGGEFPRVNGYAQQGLVRFAPRSIAANEQGPQDTGTSQNPKLFYLGGGKVRAGFVTNWDKDDLTLTYDLLRSDKGDTPVASTTLTSTFWTRPSASLVDPTAVPGQTYTYRIRSSDPHPGVANPGGVKVTSDPVTITVPAADPASQGYINSVLTDGANHYWRMGDSTGNLSDWAQGNDMVKLAGVTRTSDTAVNDTEGASAFTGTSTGVAGQNYAETPGSTFAVEAWFKTTTTTGGKIVGLGSSQTGNSGNYDRHIYMDNTGNLSFGVYNGSTQTIRTTKAYNDNKWHQVVGSLSSAGMKFYVDGALVGSKPTVTTVNLYPGYWRVGGDNLSGWPNIGTSSFFKGSIDEVAVYPSALTDAKVAAHFKAVSNVAPTASFTNSCTSAGSCSFDASASADSDGTIASYAWDFGDTTNGTGKTTTHAYTKSGTYTVKLTVTDDNGAATSTTKSITVSVPAPNQPPTAAFSADCPALNCSFDASDSADSDGTIASYAWDFGDSKSGTGKTTSHTYDAAGSYDVKLTVTDDQGATATKTITVTVAAAANKPPTAAFTNTTSNTTVSFDGTGSSDPDGTVSSYAWDFGDGSNGTGSAPSHNYGDSGVFSVKLTVTDNRGGTDSVTKTVVVNPNEVVRDLFGRTGTKWGSADVGGAYTTSGAQGFSTNGSSGNLVLNAAGANSTATLGSVSAASVDAVVDVSVNKAAQNNAIYATLAARRTGSSDYRAKLRFITGGAVRVQLVRNVSGTEKVLSETTISGLTYTVGDTLRMRFTVSGSGTSTLTAKVWKAGSAEPSNPQAKTTDTEPTLQSAGGVAVQGQLGSSEATPITYTFDNLLVSNG